MKTLYLVRHGKSNWDDLSLNDIERPLKKRGIQNSIEMSRIMLAEKEIPEIIFTSPAVRTYETAKLFAEHLKVPINALKVQEKLYLPDFSTLLKLILYLDNAIQSAMVVGHEPSLSYFINYFISKPLEKVATASVTTLNFDTNDWRDISPKHFSKGNHRNRHQPKGFLIV